MGFLKYVNFKLDILDYKKKIQADLECKWLFH